MLALVVANGHEVGLDDEEDLFAPMAPPAPGWSTDPTPEPISNMTPDVFQDAVRTAKDHIRAGDIFQVVLSAMLCIISGPSP